MSDIYQQLNKVGCVAGLALTICCRAWEYRRHHDIDLISAIRDDYPEFFHEGYQATAQVNSDFINVVVECYKILDDRLAQYYEPYIAGDTMITNALQHAGDLYVFYETTTR